MTTESKRGTNWGDDELDLIVSDYFDMLESELSRKPYIKARHNSNLMKKLDRSHRSVEFKHQNISAVLDKLGMPWIPGYKPKWNFQNAIFDAIDRYLSSSPNVTESVPEVMPIVDASSAVFTSAPTRKSDDGAVPTRLGQLITKFDPAKRDFINRSLGKEGEAFVVELESRRLTEAGRKDLAKKIRWTSQEEGDGAGYDVSSFNLELERPMLIEVKTTNGSARTPFFITRTEAYVATMNVDDWKIYRVHLFATNPHVFVIAPPLEHTLKLTPETWRASI